MFTENLVGEPTWQDKVKAELKELFIKHGKLEKYIDSRGTDTFDLLNIQLSVMESYVRILGQRLVNDGMTIKELDELEQSTW